MNLSSLYFVSGVSGVGKTSVMPYLKADLPANFEVHDFDEGGVPKGADHIWRIERTKEWINFADRKAAEQMNVVVCGIANPDEIEPMKKDFPNLDIKMILLDGDVQVIEQRLRSRNQNDAVLADLKRVIRTSAETFIQDNNRFLPVLREIYKKYDHPIIDTSTIDPKEVAGKLLEYIK